MQALQGKNITIHGDKRRTGSFQVSVLILSCSMPILFVASHTLVQVLKHVLQYVDDLVAGLIALMEGSYANPVNLGNPKEFRIEVWNSCEFF